jgi:RNA polymerase sigma factor (sigma-70 family)
MDRFAFDDLYVRRLKEHDRETEDHFSKFFGEALFAKLHNRLPPQDVDDAVQDVLARVLSRLDELREGCKLAAFVLGFCNNVLLERYRNKESRTERLDEPHEKIVGESNPEAELLKKEATACVRQVLSGMGDTRDADILRKIFLYERDRGEVCRRFGVDAKYLRVLLHRAKKEFRAAYRRRRER